jgi:adenylosuccinate synthase
VIPNWVAEVVRLAHLVAPDQLLAGWLRETPAVVFEGAQGLLLDEAVGFHPFCTWSDCTARNARELLAEAAPDAALHVWGVTRAHAYRHGAGPLPSETGEVRPGLDHNAENAWQGSVRYGWFDAVLARYALALAGPLDTLCITHVDLLGQRRRWPICTGYRVRGAGDPSLVDQRGQLVPVVAPPLERQFRMAETLGRCSTVTAELPGDESGFLAELETLLDRRVDAISRGPQAGDVVIR